MAADRRTKEWEAAKFLNSRKETAEVLRMLDLLSLRLEGFKDQLVNAPETEFPRLQGKAQAIEKLLKDLTEPPAKIA